MVAQAAPGTLRSTAILLESHEHSSTRGFLHVLAIWTQMPVAVCAASTWLSHLPSSYWFISASHLLLSDSSWWIVFVCPTRTDKWVFNILICNHKQNIFLKLPLFGTVGWFLAPLRGSQYSVNTKCVIHALDVSYLITLSFVGKN